MAAGSDGEFWSLRTEYQEGGQRTVFSLVREQRDEVVVLNTVESFVDAASSDDGATACIVGLSVRSFRRSGTRVNTLFCRDARAYLATFVTPDYLAVSRFGNSWLEVWRMRGGMPTVAAVHSPSEITSMSGLGHQVAAGLRSGEILVLRLRGKDTQTDLEENYEVLSTGI
jgi:hypothetical protein